MVRLSGSQSSRFDSPQREVEEEDEKPDRLLSKSTRKIRNLPEREIKTTHYPKLNIMFRKVEMGEAVTGTLVSRSNRVARVDERTAFVTSPFLPDPGDIPVRREGVLDRLNFFDLLLEADT